MTARGTVSKKHQTAIRAAMAAKERADEKLHDAIRAAATDPVERASIRELANFTHLAPNTIVKIVNG